MYYEKACKVLTNVTMVKQLRRQNYLCKAVMQSMQRNTVKERKVVWNAKYYWKVLI